MNKDSPASLFRNPRFESPAGCEALRPVTPPQWLQTGFLLTLLAAVALAIAVLASNMDEFVTASGVVRPAVFTLVFARTGGILQSVSVTDGMVVKKGEVLGRMDDWEVQKQIGKIKGDIEQAKPEVELAQATVRKIEAAPVPPEFLFSGLEVERQQEVRDIQQDYFPRLTALQRAGSASGTEVLNVRLQIIASEALLKRSQQANDLMRGGYGTAAKEEAAARERVIESWIKSLERNLAEAQEDLRRLEIVAPESGTILATARRYPGEKINAGDALFKVTQNSGVDLRLYATEDRVNLIAPGQPGQLVRFRANNNPDRLAPLARGRVIAVASDRDLEADPDAGQNQGVYRVTVAIENTPYQLAVGATVQAEIVIARRPFWQLLFMKSANAK